MAAITAVAGGGNASAGATWVGGVAPVTGDTIVVPANNPPTIVDWDAGVASVTLGSKSAGVGHAFTINGSSSSSYGRLRVSAGSTLRVAGFDRSSNLAGRINQYGRFEPQPGSTISVDLASDGGSFIDNRGYITSDYLSGSRITWTVPSGNYNWNTSVAGEVRSVNGYYNLVGPVCAVRLNNPWIGNAAGTGLGSFGDSSLSLSATSPSGAFTTEVATIDDITATGHYAVDYKMGVVFGRTTGASGGFTASYKRLESVLGYTIQSTQNATANQCVFRGNDFYYGGQVVNADDYLLHIQNKRSVTVAVERLAEVVACGFYYCRRAIGLKASQGASGDRLKFEDNTFDSCSGDSSYGEILMAYRQANSWVSWQRNRMRCRTWALMNSMYGGTFDQANWLIKDNTIHAAGFVFGVEILGPWSNSTFEGNVHLGTGAAFDARSIAAVGGTSGNAAVVTANAILRAHRAVNYAPYLTLSDNWISANYHHGVNSPPTIDDIWMPGVSITGNVMRQAGSDGAHIELGYNHHAFTDGAVVKNNTLDVNTGQGGISLGDLGDNFGTHSTTDVQIQSNLITSATTGLRRPTDTTAVRCVPGVALMDRNAFNGNTSNYTNINRQARFTRSGVDYGTDATRLVAGVTLWNPSYSTTQAGRSLVLTYTSATNITLGWGGGTAVQLVFGSGTATAGANSVYFGVTGAKDGTLTNSGASWSTLLNNTNCPAGKWVKITGGTGVGQVRRISKNTATVLTVVPAWTTVPDATSTYSIIHGEAQVYDSGATDSVWASVDARSLPTSTQTDTSIVVTITTDITSAPSFANSSYDLATWDAAKGGSGKEYAGFLRLWTDPTLCSDFVAKARNGYAPANTAYDGAAHDGGDIGAISVAVASSSSPFAARFNAGPGGLGIGVPVHF